MKDEKGCDDVTDVLNVPDVPDVLSENRCEG